MSPSLAGLPSGSGTPSYAPVVAALEQWRKHPDDAQLDKRVQQQALEWLLSQSDDHWFCSNDGSKKADKQYKQALFDVACFNVRLIGFKPTNKVLDWRKHLEHLLTSCHFCVAGWVKAQRASGTKFLRRKWSEDVVLKWYQSLYSREVDRITDLLNNTDDGKLKAAKISIWVYNVLSDPHLFNNEGLKKDISRELPEPSDFFNDLPKNAPVAPGVVAWIVCNDEKLRAWANECIALQSPITLEEFRDGESYVGDVICSLVHQGMEKDKSSRQMSIFSITVDVCLDDNPSAYWHGLYRLYEWLPIEVICSELSGSKARTGLNAMRMVAAHLGDPGEHWLEVIQCFRILLEKLDTEAWSDNLTDGAPASDAGLSEKIIDAGYAGARLHDALENPGLLRELESSTKSDSSRQSLMEETLFGWIYFFLRSLRKSRFFLPCFSIICSRLLDDYGSKSHFGEDVRVRTIKAACKILNVLYTEADEQGDANEDWDIVAASRSDLERRASLIVNTAFKATQSENPLIGKAARSAQLLLHTLAASDARRFRLHVYQLADFRNRLNIGEDASRLQVDLTISIPTELYRQSAELLALQPNITAFVGFTKAIDNCCHIPKLSSRSWVLKDSVTFDKYLKTSLKTANEQRESFIAPFLSMLQSLADQDSASIKAFLERDGMDEVMMHMILSSQDLIANRAQSVIRQGFDVSSRVECIRALLAYRPEGSLKGVILALRTFKDAAVRLPEACAQAKRLVRCLTDVITILCDPTDPMIRSDQWLELNNARPLLSKLWSLMCTDIAIIFEKTEHWAPAFENEEMTTWMRDALIFQKEMIDELRAFEAAVSGSSLSTENPTPVKLTSKGKQMVDALNDPLVKMTAWLRLNDRDLLEQTTNVTVQMLERFARSRINVHTDVVKRIRKLGEKMKDPKARRDLLLRPEQVQALLAALAKHPNYSKELSGLINPEKREEAKQERSRLSDGISTSKVSKIGENGKAPPIEVDSDDSSEDVITVVSTPIARKTAQIEGSQYQIAGNGKKMPTRPVAPGKVAKPIPGHSTLTGPRPLGRYKTAPTRMKNAIYSHAAMRAAKGQSSSDEDDDDSEDDTRPKAGLAGFHEGPKDDPVSRGTKPAHALKAPGERKAKLLDLSGNTSDRQISRRRGQRIMTAAEAVTQSQNKARMRFNPDYTDLHRQILQWNANESGSIPLAHFRYPHAIPQSFADAHEYIDNFLPLLLLECWSEILSAKEEIASGETEIEPFTGRLAGRIAVDDFVEIFLSVNRLGDRNSVTENDIVLLTGPCMLLGKVHQILRKFDKIDVVVRCHLGRDDGLMGRSLSIGTNWVAHKVFSLSTAHREYSGLMSLPYYDMLDEILQPAQHEKPDADEVLVGRAMQAYRVNEPQAAAILAAMATRGFSLIQGPPGTGKTKTILGLIGAFISGRTARPTTIRPGENAAPASGATDKILVCAPSNAAVDEIAKRLKDGVYDSEGRKFIPKVVRIGAESAIHASVSDIFLDNLVEKALGGACGKTAAGEAQANMASVRTELQVLKGERDDKRNEKTTVAINTALLSTLTAEISRLTQRINDLGDQLDRERDKLTQSNRAMETQRRKVRADILSNADVICSTLSGSGHDYLANYDFETVIIDEAAQSVEISSLIPLKYNCRRCIMVGDPNQLPPTVKSREATKAGYNKSLFLRLHTAAPAATHLLSIQYRMHPDISVFPSKAFYESRLTDGPNMDVTTKQTWHNVGDIFPPYAFLHVKGSKEERGKHHSLVNRQEAAVAAALYARLLQDCKGVDFTNRIGIVTAYKAQVGELRKQFRTRFGAEVLGKIDFNTVDGFQGQEKDIIILSCVRGGTPEGSGIGFLSDVRRMNVALTRARSSLWVLGDSNALQSNDNWRKLVEDATERGFLREVDVNTFALKAPDLPANANLSRKSPGNVAKGKKKASETAKYAILPAPAGLMRPSDLAKSTSSLAHSDNKNDILGAKRRLTDAIKAEELDPAETKRSKQTKLHNGRSISNASAALSSRHSTVKAEEESLEEGELMEGVQESYPQAYTSNVSTRASALPDRPPDLLRSTVQQTETNGSALLRPAGLPQKPSRSAIGSGIPKTGPLLVAPKKPGNSMFIPRKKLGPGPSRPS